VVDHDAKPSVRIDPFEFLHCAFQDDGLLSIEHSEGMMRKCGRRERGYRESGQADDFKVHGRLLWPISDISASIIVQYMKRTRDPIAALWPARTKPLSTALSTTTSNTRRWSST